MQKTTTSDRALTSQTDLASAVDAAWDGVGQSFATTMGLTALDGRPMGLCCGALDPGVVLHLIMDRGGSAQDARDLLCERSGLLGVSGISGEMNDLRASDRPEAAEAAVFFVYRCGRTFESLAAAPGGVGGVVLTGAMGEHIPESRARLVGELSWLRAVLDPEANDAGGPYLTTPQSRLPVLMLATDEERVLARSACDVMASPGRAASGDPGNPKSEAGLIDNFRANAALGPLLTRDTDDIVQTIMALPDTPDPSALKDTPATAFIPNPEHRDDLAARSSLSRTRQ